MYNDVEADCKIRHCKRGKNEGRITFVCSDRLFAKSCICQCLSESGIAFFPNAFQRISCIFFMKITRDCAKGAWLPMS